MILGLGIDLVHVPDFAEQLADAASTFSETTFSAKELAYARSAASRDPARHLAARFAAKEATLKALDAASGRAGVPPGVVPLSDIEVDRDDRGRPWLVLRGAAEALARRVGVDRVHVSLSHDGPSATAVVVLEGV